MNAASKQEAAEESGLLAHHPVDEIGFRFRQKQHFLAAFHEPDAATAARTDGNFRLPLLISGVAGGGGLLRISKDATFRVELVEQFVIFIDKLNGARKAVRLHGDEAKPQYQAQGGANCQVPILHARDKHHADCGGDQTRRRFPGRPRRPPRR